MSVPTGLMVKETLEERREAHIGAGDLQVAMPLATRQGELRAVEHHHRLSACDYEQPVAGDLERDNLCGNCCTDIGPEDDAM